MLEKFQEELLYNFQEPSQWLKSMSQWISQWSKFKIIIFVTPSNKECHNKVVIKKLWVVNESAFLIM